MAEGDIRVEVPGKGVINFPRGTSQAEMEAAIGQLEGGAASRDPHNLVTSSAVRAAAGMVGMPGDMLNLARAGRNFFQGMSLPPPLLPGPSFNDPNATPEQRRRDWGIARSSDIIKTFENYTGAPLAKPQHIGEGVAGSMMEGAFAGAPWGLPGIVGGAGGGLFAELAGQVSSQNPLARGGGGLFGSLIASLPFMLRGRPPQQMLLEMLGDDPKVAAATLSRAADIQSKANTIGAPVTLAEAVAQAEKNASHPLLNVQRSAEASIKGGPVFAPYMAARPDQQRSAVMATLDEVGPQVTAPSETAHRIKTAADKAISEERKAGNLSARPWYDTAETSIWQTMPWLRKEYDALVENNPIVRQAIDHVSNSPWYGVSRPKPGMQPQTVPQMTGSIARLDAAKKYLDDMAGKFASEEMNHKASIAIEQIDKIVGFAKKAVPAYGKALDIIADHRTNALDPMRRSALGQLSESPTFAAQKQVLFPDNPETLNPSQVRWAIRHIGMSDATAARDMTRQFLETRFNEVAQNLRTGPNQWGGPNWVSNITANPAQRANLQAAVEALPDGKGTWKGFERLIEVMEAQGKRQAPGSQTEQNRLLTQEMTRGGVGAEVAGAAASAAAGSVLHPTTGIPGVARLTQIAQQEWERTRLGRNSEAIARILTDPESAKKLRAMAMHPPTSPKNIAIANALLTGTAVHTER